MLPRVVHEIHPTPWTVEFDELGGYDALCAAYCVKDAHGRHVVAVETSTYVKVGASWEERHEPVPAARAVAECVAELANRERGD